MGGECPFMFQVPMKMVTSRFGQILSSSVGPSNEFAPILPCRKFLSRAFTVGMRCSAKGTYTKLDRTYTCKLLLDKNLLWERSRVMRSFQSFYFRISRSFRSCRCTHCCPICCSFCWGCRRNAEMDIFI